MSDNPGSTRSGRGSRKRAREDRKAARAAPARVAQLPFGPLVNSYPPLGPLTEEQLELIHQASLDLLRDPGIEVMSQRVRNAFEREGAKIDEDRDVVLADPEMILELVARAPSTFTLTPRNVDHALTLGGNQTYFGMVSGPPNVHDRVGGRRVGNFADYQKLLSLGQHFNVIALFGNQTVATTDLPVTTRHLDCYLANLTLTDKVFSAIPIGEGRVNDAAHMLALARGVALEELRDQPGLIGNINVNSPRKTGRGDVRRGTLARSRPWVRR